MPNITIGGKSSSSCGGALAPFVKTPRTVFANKLPVCVIGDQMNHTETALISIGPSTSNSGTVFVNSAPISVNGDFITSHSAGATEHSSSTVQSILTVKIVNAY